MIIIVSIVFCCYKRRSEQTVEHVANDEEHQNDDHFYLGTVHRPAHSDISPSFVYPNNEVEDNGILASPDRNVYGGVWANYMYGNNIYPPVSSNYPPPEESTPIGEYPRPPISLPSAPYPSPPADSSSPSFSSPMHRPSPSSVRSQSPVRVRDSFTSTPSTFCHFTTPTSSPISFSCSSSSSSSSLSSCSWVSSPSSALPAAIYYPPPEPPSSDQTGSFSPSTYTVGSYRYPSGYSSQNTSRDGASSSGSANDSGGGSVGGGSGGGGGASVNVQEGREAEEEVEEIELYE